MKLERSRLELLEGLRDGVAGEVGRDRSTAALGCCEDCKRFRNASSEDDPLLRVDGERFELGLCKRLGAELGC